MAQKKKKKAVWVSPAVKQELDKFCRDFPEFKKTYLVDEAILDKIKFLRIARRPIGDANG